MQGAELRELRGRWDVTQGTLADALRVGQQTVSEWELGFNPIPDWAEQLLLDPVIMHRLFKKQKRRAKEGTV